jgi:hypothetical protein
MENEQISYLSLIPKELVDLVFIFVPIEKLATICSRVCVEWKNRLQNETLWKQIYRYDIINSLFRISLTDDSEFILVTISI